MSRRSAIEGGTAITDPHLVLDRLRILLDILENSPTHGTHKFALALAMLDTVPTRPVEEDGPMSIGVGSLADRILEMYWAQTRPFVVSSGPSLQLAQINRGARGPHAYLSSVQTLQALSPGSGLHALQHGYPMEYERERKSVAEALVANPIPRFHVGYPVGESLWTCIATGYRTRLVLKPGTADAFLQFASTIREVAERRFIDKVLSLNQVSDDRTNLEGHLFGEERVMPPPGMRTALAELQGGRCLYTGQELASPSIDHFLPWNLVHLSEIENLVVTNIPTNSSKGSRLAGPACLQRLQSHRADSRDALVSLAREYSWPSNPDRVLQAATQFYERGRSQAFWSP